MTQPPGTPSHRIKIRCYPFQAEAIGAAFGGTMAWLDKTQKVDPAYFDRIEIPQRVFDPKKRQGLGISLVTSQGLVKKGERGIPVRTPFR